MLDMIAYYRAKVTQHMQEFEFCHSRGEKEAAESSRSLAIESAFKLDSYVSECYQYSNSTLLN